MDITRDQTGLLTRYGRLYTEQRSHAMLEELHQCVCWQDDFIAYGRRFEIPRRQAWYADSGIHYRYSENKLQTHGWIEPLRSVKQDIESLTGQHFNSVLLTYYRDGWDHVAWHADDEAELGPFPVIASLSLGARRNLQYRNRHSGEHHSLPLDSGELIIMQPRFQQDWEHAVLPQPDVQQPRLNLTFRKVLRRAVTV